MIDRHNILDLLGQNTKKYHSCIITCYSFDFIYFEQRVLPKLRQAGIININVYVDAYQLEKQMQQYIDSNLLNLKTSYSIIPVKMRCAFHPKIILAIGSSKGFLALGSGNITSSGLSSNEEIWSAFHMTESENLAEPIFQSVSAYLQKFESYLFGTNLLKLQWIQSNSSWFSKFRTVKPQNKLLELKHESLEVLYTDGEQSIFDVMSHRLPLHPKCIKILSPYYNSNGELLQKLMMTFQPEKMHCVVDPIFGTMPYKMMPNNRIEFSDWHTLEKESKYQNNRLHAKAFQFEYDNETFFLFGSANATVEAFGTSGKESHSAEASILLHSKKTKNYLHQLGVNFPKKGIFIIPENTVESQDPSQEPLKFTIFIQHSEFESTNLTFNIEKTFNQPCIIKVEDCDGQLLQEKLFDSLELINSLQLPEQLDSKPFSLSIYSLNKRISNFSIIHSRRDLLHTNPDSRLANFNTLFNSNFFGDLELEELLEFISVKNDAFDTRYQAHKKMSGQDDENYESVQSISETEFNKNAGILQTSEFYSNYIISRTEEFLNSLNFEDKGVEDITDSIEQLALDAYKEGLDGETVSTYKKQSLTSIEGKRIAYKIAITLKKITDALWKQKIHHIDSKFAMQSLSLATFHHLNALLIGFHLFLKERADFYSENRHLLTIKYLNSNDIKQFEFEFRLTRNTSQTGNLNNEISYTLDEENLPALKSQLQSNKAILLKHLDTTPSVSSNYSFLPPLTWPKNYMYDGISDFITDGLGSFLLLLTKEKMSQVEEMAKWDEKIRRLLLMSVITLMHCRWPDKTRDTKQLLLLNIFHFLNSYSESEILKSELLKSITKLKHEDFITIEEIEEIYNLHKLYIIWLQKYLEDPKSLKKVVSNQHIDSIIFNKTYGFSKLKWCYAKTVNLETPLGLYDEERDIFGFSNVFIGTSPAFFN